jgi:hypothetical protein
LKDEDDERDSKKPRRKEMKKALSFVLAAAFALSFFAFAFADVTTTFYGYQWLRYDYQAVGGSYGAPATGSNNTFSIPRTYLRWKVAGDGYEGNITLDINNTNAGENSGKNMGAITMGSIDWASWLKYAYVEFNNIPYLSSIDAVIRAGQQAVYFGTIDTWQYPTVEKTIEDLHSFVSGCDNGVALVGKLPQGYGSYEAAIYNGTGYKDTAEDSTQDITDKAYDLSLNITPIAGLYVRGSYFKKLTNVFGSIAKNYSASAVVVGGATGPIEAFEEYVTCVGITGNVGAAVGWESYLGMNLTDLVELHLRIDTYDPDTKVARNEQNTYIAGVNLNLTKATVLQLDYELTENKFPGSGAKDNNITNNNQFISQIAWKW